MNQESDIVIIGCGAGGGTAAQFARKTDRKAKITIYGKETYPQYSKCGLPYTISKTIPKYNDLIEFSEEWFKKNQIDLFLDFTVEKIDVKNQLIKVKIGNNTIEKSYTSLIIATGAQPWIPPIQNIGEARNLLDGVFILRNMDNAKQISSFIKKDKIKKATIIGAGFIGLEIADVLHKMNIEVTLVEAFSNILVNAFDEDIAGVITEEISKNIKLYSNHIATKVEANNKKIQKVYIKNNKNGEVNQINTDLLIISTGCRPNVALGKDAGCRIGKKGGIIVNEKAETTIKDIYAIGDCTEYSDFITGESIISGLGSIAVRQGISAGFNAAG